MATIRYSANSATIFNIPCSAQLLNHEKTHNFLKKLSILSTVSILKASSGRLHICKIFFQHYLVANECGFPLKQNLLLKIAFADLTL